MIHPRQFTKRLKNHIKESPRVFLLYSILRILVICVLVRQIFERNYEGVGVCALVLLLFLIPSFMEQQFEIEIPPLFEGIIYVFIFAAEILGEVDHFYVALPGWDTILHTINGFLAAAVGFSMVDLLNRHSKRMQLSPFYVAMVAFCFSMTIGVMWEFIECTGDLFFGQDMQKDFIVSSFNSVTLDPANSQKVVRVRDITRTVICTASGETYTIDGGYLDIVTFASSMWKSVCNVRFQGRQRAHEECRAADSVYVIVAMNADQFTVAHRLRDALHGGFDVRQEKRVVQGLHRGVHECADAIWGIDATNE